MTSIQKLQLQSLLHILAKRHPSACDALAQAARGGLSQAQRDAVLSVLPVDVMGNVSSAAAAHLSALISAVDALEVQ